MAETRHECKVARVLVSAHAYGTPLEENEIVNRAAVPSDELGDLKDGIESARSYAFIENHGNRGLKLDNSEFDSLVQFLHDECGWERFELGVQLKHFEGWDTIEW